MAAKNGFRSPLRYLCNSGANQVVKSSIEVKSQRKVFTKNKSFTSDGNLQLTVKLRRQILTFREVLDLPPVDGAILTPELLTTTVEDLYKMYPEIIQKLPISDIRGASTKQGLVYFCTALVSIGDSWTKTKEWRPNINSDLHDEHEKISSEKLIGDMLLTLDRITKLAKVKFDIMNVEENDQNKSRAIDIVLKKRPNEICSGGSSPISPTSVLPELPETWNHDHFGGFFTSYTVNHTVPVKLQLVGTPNSTEVKNLPFHTFMGVEDKYPVHWLNNREADTPPADKKVKLDLGVAVQGNRKNQDEMLEVVGGGNLTRLALQAPNQLLGKSISQPEFSAKALAKPAHTLKSTTEPLHGLTQISARPMPKPLLEPPSIESTLPILPPPEFQNPSALQPLLLTSPHQSSNLLVPLPPPSPATHTEVLGDLKGLLPVPPLPPPAPTSMSGTQRTPPPPPSMISSILKGTPPLPLPSNLKAPPPPPPPSNLRGPPPPPLPMIPSNGSPLLPPMPPGHGGGAPPPPPSLGGRPLGLKAITKLKRSSQMGTLYRLLKGKVEGSSLNGKSTQGRKSQVGTGTSGKQGMADALAEITKRSAYFQQIEEDARKYAKTITELKSTITAFQTKDMTELVKFHKQVESQLENLTDESQVLTRFEGFPTKKLECLRMAAALYLKLNSIHTTIVNWKIVPPMSQLLVKVDAYFTKIKGEVDAIERTKDEELKKFKSHNIHFDFNILVKIKESMVDLSSGCMELALKESREAKSLFNGVNSPKKGSEGPAKMLWKAFQLAFRVYTFAGGQDDRADMLTKELAQEIETEPDL